MSGYQAINKITTARRTVGACRGGTISAGNPPSSVSAEHCLGALERSQYIRTTTKMTADRDTQILGMVSHGYDGLQMAIDIPR